MKLSRLQSRIQTLFQGKSKKTANKSQWAMQEVTIDHRLEDSSNPIFKPSEQKPNRLSARSTRTFVRSRRRA
ncbi:hypothetical protein CEXT_346221 [Caerostris extrusa]|uniref:Uncharacterized protein n=1 Tax=Caerostris extrusa TaxID=172846 RepID=A0AAV4Q467_CAEEX|nr:hypothetical protein CEXT_346221 [Caerostris extrusa]